MVLRPFHNEHIPGLSGDDLTEALSGNTCWLAIKDLKHTIPSSQGWASSVHFTVTLFLNGLII